MLYTSHPSKKFDGNFNISRYNKNLTKINLKMSKTFTLHNNNAGTLSINLLKKKLANTQLLFFSIQMNLLTVKNPNF